MEEKQSSWPSCAGLLGTSYWKRTPPHLWFGDSNVYPRYAVHSSGLDGDVRPGRQIYFHCLHHLHCLYSPSSDAATSTSVKTTAITQVVTEDLKRCIIWFKLSHWNAKLMDSEWAWARRVYLSGAVRLWSCFGYFFLFLKQTNAFSVFQTTSNGIWGFRNTAGHF